MDRGVQWATVHGVAKSRIQLSMPTQKKGKGAFQTERTINAKVFEIGKSLAPIKEGRNFPGGGTVDRILPAIAGDRGLIPGPERFHMPQSN